MEKLPKRVYTQAFKDEAAKLVVRDGLGVTEAARRLGMSVKTLAHWVAAARGGQAERRGAPVTELEAEVARLKRELAEMKMERDVLKKATAYFAKASR